jgi:hypothetical protein
MLVKVNSSLTLLASREICVQKGKARHNSLYNPVRQALAILFFASMNTAIHFLSYNGHQRSIALSIEFQQSRVYSSCKEESRMNTTRVAEEEMKFNAS